MRRVEGKSPKALASLDMKKGFKAACRRAGIKGLRFHDLRHTFATRLVEKGADTETVRDLLGHHSITVTQRYTHSNDERKRKVVELLGCDVCVTHGRIGQHRAPVAQLDRASDYESEGRGFKSLRAYQPFTSIFNHLRCLSFCTVRRI